MKFISLLTDFGLRDGYAGIMHGVIYGIAPDAQIADISHTIRPQNILEGSLTWNRSYRYFPAGAVHVAVVDPGVGTTRRPIAARLGDYFFVCPDNGLLTPMLEDAEKAGDPIEIVHLDQPRYWLPQVSNVFHGRDIFSPCAAHIANGVPLSEIGTPISDPIRQSLPQPSEIENGWRCQIISVDHFGNLSTNLNQQQVAQMQDPQVRIGGKTIRGLSKSFGSRDPGDLVAFIDSDDTLAIAVVNGDAARELGIDLGEPVEVVKAA